MGSKLSEVTTMSYLTQALPTTTPTAPPSSLLGNDHAGGSTTSIDSGTTGSNAVALTCSAPNIRRRFWVWECFIKTNTRGLAGCKLCLDDGAKNYSHSCTTNALPMKITGWVKICLSPEKVLVLWKYLDSLLHSRFHQSKIQRIQQNAGW